MTTNAAIELRSKLSKAVQAALKEFVEEDIAQSGNHCPHCAWARAEAHLVAVLDTTTTVVDVTKHTHRTGRERPVAELPT